MTKKKTGRIKDKTGERYGKLTVIECVGSNQKGALWRCKCDCGNEVIRLSKHLKASRFSSCGCAKEEFEKEKLRKLSQQATNKKDAKKPTMSLCWACIRSAAPPSLQCSWDKSRAKELPEGAEIELTHVKTGNYGGYYRENTTVTSCPEFLSVYDKENAELLKAERKKNEERKAKEKERYYSSTSSAVCRL